MVYCTPEDVQVELRATSAFSSATTPTESTVKKWIIQASDSINSDSGRVWGPYQYTDYVDYDGTSEYITLRNSPVILANSVLYNTNSIGSASGEAYVLKTEDSDYSLYKDTGELYIIGSNFSPRAGNKRFKIIYTAGMSTIPGRVNELCAKMVTDRVLSSLLNQNVNDSNDGGSISVGSITIVEPGAYGVANYKRLREDIKELQNKITEGFGVYRYGN